MSGGETGGRGDPEERARTIRDRIRGNFDRGASRYARFETRWRFFRRLLGELLQLAEPLDGSTVLDVGCGTGASLEGLLEATGPEGKVWGIDVSLGMLTEARKRLGARVGLAAVDGCGYGAAFRVPFDAVVYNAVLFMLPDGRRSLESAREVLTPGGQVLISHLEGVCGPEGEPVTELLARRGFRAGRHALFPWEPAGAVLRELFSDVQTQSLVLPLSPERFSAFYGLEPMSAGLLPTVPFPERRRAVEALAVEWQERNQGAVQSWILATGRRPK